MVRNTDVHVDYNNRVTIVCCHGQYRFKTFTEQHQALGHTGIRYFDNIPTSIHGRDAYYRFMLVGSYAHLDKEVFKKTTELEALFSYKLSFRIQFRKDIVAQKRKNNQPKTKKSSWLKRSYIAHSQTA